MSRTPEEVLIPGPAGRLEALLEEGGPADGPQRAALVLHPHPQHEGTMHNKVVHMLSRSLNRLGVATLRFNFRGVGASEGAYDEGRGETEDALAAAAWLQERYPGAELWLGGFSFGAGIALKAAADLPVRQLISVAPPVERLDLDAIGVPDCPWLIVQGEDDEIVDADGVVDWVNRLPPGPRLVLLPETGHFFHGKLTLLRDVLLREMGGGG